MALLTEIDSLAHWVRFHRKAKGWTQSELARNAGMAHSRISDVECGRGDPQIGTIVKIANALGVSVSSLLMPTDEKVLEKVV